MSRRFKILIVALLLLSAGLIVLWLSLPRVHIANHSGGDIDNIVLTIESNGTEYTRETGPILRGDSRTIRFATVKLCITQFEFDYAGPHDGIMSGTYSIMPFETDQLIITDDYGPRGRRLTSWRWLSELIRYLIGT